MKFKLFISIMLLMFVSASHAQTETRTNSKKGMMYTYWGYNSSVYAPSNIHFNGPEFDVTFYDVEASDRPSEFGWVYFDPGRFTIPQYNFRIGYFINEKLNISIGVDHMKYVVNANQIVRFSGVISESVSPEYAGTYLNQDIELKPELLKFEHSDGLNYASLDFEYLIRLNKKSSKNFAFNWNVGLGGIWMITKTNVKILGVGLDNDFQLGGLAFSGKTGPRLEFRNRFFILGEVKGGYASLPSLTVVNEGPESADHNITFLEYYLTAGVYFGGKENRQARTLKKVVRMQRRLLRNEN